MRKTSKELREAIQKASLNQETAEHVCFAILTRGEEGLNWCHDLGLINTENEHKYRIALTQKNPDTQKIELRYPLLETQVDTDFISYYIAVGSQLPKAKGKLDNTNASKQAFETLSRQIKNFDQQRLVEATVEYYNTEEFSKKLSNFLLENARLCYETYKPKMNTMI